MLIVHVATFAATGWAAQVPIFTALSLNVTVPVGVPAPGRVTLIVAVNVTLCPQTDGFADETKAVVVAAWLT